MPRSATEPQQHLDTPRYQFRNLPLGHKAGKGHLSLSTFRAPFWLWSESCLQSLTAGRRTSPRRCQLAQPRAQTSAFQIASSIRGPAITSRTPDRGIRHLKATEAPAWDQQTTMAERRVTIKNVKGEQMVGILHDSGSEVPIPTACFLPSIPAL